MKKLFLLCLYTLLPLMVTPAFSARPTNCDAGTCHKEDNWDDQIGAWMNCGAPTCTCINAATMQETEYVCGCYEDSDCGDDNECQNNRCVECRPCNCQTTSAWTSTNAYGVQTRTHKDCPCNSSACTLTKYSYQCGPGYYGPANSSSSGCTRCPPPETGSGDTGNYTVTSNAGATKITQCYLVPPSTVTDNIGTYEISGGNCFYKQ